MILRPPRSPLFPDTTLFRSSARPVRLDTPTYARAYDAPDARDGMKPERSPLQKEEVQISQARNPMSVERSEEHTSELQSRQYLVCRLLLEKKEIHSALMTDM